MRFGERLEKLRFWKRREDDPAKDWPDGILLARPSFLGGLASIIDVGGTLNNYDGIITGEQADRIALANDARAVALDIAAAVERVRLSAGED